MNKKVLVMAVALLAVAMLATPLASTAQACGCGGEKRHHKCARAKFEFFELYCSGAADATTGTQKDIFRNDVLKLRIIRDRGWVTGDVVNMTVGDKIFTMDTEPYSVNWTTTFDALIFFNDDGTNKITFINLVDVATVYDNGVAIGTLVLKLRSTIDFATTPPTYSGTVRGYGTEALKGVRISGVDVGLVDPVNGIFMRNGTITGWPKYVTNA